MTDDNLDWAAEYVKLHEQYKWLHAIVSIIVEEEGGVVEIPAETLETYNLSGSLQIAKDEGATSYHIEVLPVGTAE